MTKMAKIDTYYIYDQNGWKTPPLWGRTYLYSPYKGVPPRDPDPWDAGAVLHQLSYQAKWEVVIMRVNDKPVDSGYVRSNSWNLIYL